ncbi:MAG: hypothetical protein ACFB50_03430 [Rubrobacteraceae bacterium]
MIPISKLAASRLLLLAFLVFLLAGCGESRDTGEAPPETTSPGQKAPGASSSPKTNPETTPGTTRETPREAAGSTTAENAEDGTRPERRAEGRGEIRYGYTYGQASGNLVVEGTGGLPESDPVDVPLDGRPAWVVGVPLGNATAWVAALADGRVQAFRLDGSNEAELVSISPDRLPPGQPPLVKARGDSLELVTSRNAEVSELTHPVPASPEEEGTWFGVSADGSVFEEVDEGDFVGIGELGITAIPDARFVRGAGGTLAFLSDPTTLYEHDVLGDGVEAGSMTLLRPEEGATELGVIFPASGGVFEQVAPMWFEAPGVEGELLAITESTEPLATRLSVYSLNGSLVAAGPYIGEPMKWRHLLAAGPFGPNGETELVNTLTPHLGGTIEFHRPDFANGSLNIVATQPGYTSHRINSRNLDTARAGDLDGDGRWEILVPNDAYTELGAIRHEAGGATVAWTLPADGTIVTNLASATTPGGRAQIAAGREDGSLRIWP